MFMRLFGYISGKNNQQREIEMTAPVLIDYQNMNKGLIVQDSNVYASMRFYVPKASQENTPFPNDGKVKIIIEPEMIVAAYCFLTDYREDVSDYIYHRDVLIQRLGDQGKYYDLNNFMTAIYDSPMVNFGRRNEVLFKMKTS